MALGDDATLAELAVDGRSSTVHCHGFGCFALSGSGWTTMVGSIFGWLLYHQRLCRPYGEPVEKVAGKLVTLSPLLPPLLGRICPLMYISVYIHWAGCSFFN
jgi:hypothetical protein